MYKQFVVKEKCAYYCKECDKIYKSCYELENVPICSICWSENIKIINDAEITPIIRNKKLKKIKSNNRK